MQEELRRVCPAGSRPSWVSRLAAGERQTWHELDRAEASTDPLAGLLGQTRAAVLRLTFRQRTTTGLARELGTSAATISGHTKTLRAAGLIVTTRAGRAVLHSVTPLGGRLLESTAGVAAGCRMLAKS